VKCPAFIDVWDKKITLTYMEYNGEGYCGSKFRAKHTFNFPSWKSLIQSLNPVQLNKSYTIR